MRKLAYLLVALLAVFWFAYSSVSAQQEKEGLKTKLADLRSKKFEMMDEYKENLHKIDKEAEERIAVIKADFRKAREKCLEDKHEKSEQLRKDFESKLKPMLKEEEELVELIGRDAMEDFAKTKAEERKSK